MSESIFYTAYDYSVYLLNTKNFIPLTFYELSYRMRIILEMMHMMMTMTTMMKRKITKKKKITSIREAKQQLSQKI